MKTFLIRYLPTQVIHPNPVREVIIEASSEKEAMSKITEKYAGHMIWELDDEDWVYAPN